MIIKEIKTAAATYEEKCLALLRSKDVEHLTYEEAKTIAEEKLEIKGHSCFFVDLGAPFGYSVLVFKDGNHIYYADDFELYHSHFIKEYGRSGLRDYYIKRLNRKLFTEKELLDPVVSYDEYQRKDHFLRNYWIMRYDHASIFAIHEKEQKEEEIEKYPYFCQTCFCRVNDPEISKKAAAYAEHLEAEKAKLEKDKGSFRKMIAAELADHEAFITCEYTEALEALGMKYEDLADWQKKVVDDELRKQIFR